MSVNVKLNPGPMKKMSKMLKDDANYRAVGSKINMVQLIRCAFVVPN